MDKHLRLIFINELNTKKYIFYVALINVIGYMSYYCGFMLHESIELFISKKYMCSIINIIHLLPIIMNNMETITNIIIICKLHLLLGSITSENLDYMQNYDNKITLIIMIPMIAQTIYILSLFVVDYNKISHNNTKYLTVTMIIMMALQTTCIVTNIMAICMSLITIILSIKLCIYLIKTIHTKKCNYMKYGCLMSFNNIAILYSVLLLYKKIDLYLATT